MTVKLSLKDITKKKIEQKTSNDLITSDLNDEKNNINIENNSNQEINEPGKITLKLNKKINIKPDTVVENKDEDKIKIENIKESDDKQNIILDENNEDITSKIEIKKSNLNSENKGELFSNYQSDFEKLIKKDDDNNNNKIVKKSRKIYIISSFSLIVLLITLSANFYIEDIKKIFKNGDIAINGPENINIDNQEYNSPIDNQENIDIKEDINGSSTGSTIENNNDNIPIDDNINNPNNNPPDEIKKKANEKIMEIYLKKAIK
ncbi:MAG: hypothetical protein PHI37_01100 [Candidatus Gracilibacteria bacterium]|nr:hypothetical protein [Candidatus Gracilibacteria bacterium]